MKYKLGELAKITRGISYKGSEYSTRDDMNAESFINLKCISADGFRWDGIKYYKGDHKSGQSAHEGDLLVANTDLTRNREVIGNSILVPKLDREKICFSHHLTKIEIYNEAIIDRKYLYYLLKAPKIRAYMVGSSDGTTVVMLPARAISRLEIDLPDLETQKKIVRILSALDNKIELNNQMCGKLEKQAEIIFKNWFIDFEPFQDNGLIETELGMIPKGWKIMPLGKIFDFRRGIALTKNDVSTKRGNDYLFVVYGAGRDIFGYSKEYALDIPSVLIAAIGAGAGTVSRSYEEKYSVTSNAFYVLPKNKFDYSYEIFALRNYNFKDRCSGSAQPMLSYGAFSEDKHIYPSTEAIEKFYKVCSPMIEKIDMLIGENNMLNNLRDTLLPKLINGEINLERIK